MVAVLQAFKLQGFHGERHTGGNNKGGGDVGEKRRVPDVEWMKSTHL